MVMARMRFLPVVALALVLALSLEPVILEFHHHIQISRCSLQLKI
jgi:hypothetical protein